jgi:putative hydrolase of the HAD superfamily
VNGFADVDAVTIDGYGTLLELHDPIGHLDRQLQARGVELPPEDIERAFEAEARFYLEHSNGARDEASLARLYVDCARVLLDELGLDLEPEDFAGAFPYEFALLPGALDTVGSLADRGLALAVVANWDYNLHDQLRRYGLDGYFAAVVVSAELGTAKPDPLPFAAALERIGVPAERAVHVGDHPNDEQGAAAAGLAFRPAPLATAFAGWK